MRFARFAVAFVVAGIAYLFEETAKVGTEINPAFVGFHNTGNNISQYEAWK